DALFAAVAGLALSYTIAKAVLFGFVTRTIPFFRTPKLANRSGLLKALAEAREELFIMLLLWCAAAGLLIGEDNPGWDLYFWVLVLQVQSLPYLAALVMALLSSLPARMPAETMATEG